jgi:hypothetical protein
MPDKTKTKVPQYPKKPVQSQRELLLLVICVPAYLYLRLFSSPGVPYLVTADQTFFWQYALRMMHGEHVYKDFFQFTPPGLDLYFLALFRLLGSQVWVANLAAILLGMALSVTCFVLASRFMRKARALLAALFFIVFVYGSRPDVTHHWFSLIASLTAIAVVMKERTGIRLVIAGMLLAMASFFTQTAGVAVGIALLLSMAWEHEYGKPRRTILRNLATLLVSSGVAWLALNAYFLVTAGWKSLWYFQAIYPWHYIDHIRGFLIPPGSGANSFSSIQRLFLFLLLLLIYPSVLWHCWRSRRKEPHENMPSVLLAMAGLLLFLSVITRSNWTRLYAVSMPAVILGMRYLDRMTPKLRRWTTVGLCSAIVCLAAIQIRGVHRQRYTVLDLYGGTMAIAQPDVEEFRWLQTHTKPGDEFLQASWPNIYLPLGLRSPVFVETLLPERTSPEFTALTIRQIKLTKVQYILWSPWLQRGLQHNAEVDNLEPLRDFMERHYARVHVFSNQDEIWQHR